MSSVRWLIALTLVFASTAEAQRRAPRCTRGIPCGNTCIAANRICHVGQPPAPSRPDTTKVRPPVAAAAAMSPAQGPPPDQITNPAFTDAAAYPWVASAADGVYFARSCTAAQDLAPANRRYFVSEAAAVEAGYRRSRTPGC